MIFINKKNKLTQLFTVMTPGSVEFDEKISIPSCVHIGDFVVEFHHLVGGGKPVLMGG